MWQIQSLGLMEGDRLEPGCDILEVADFDSWKQFPLHVVFWRTAQEQGCRHRRPLFDDELGISVESSLQIDTLHTLALGGYKSFVHSAIWQCIIDNVYQIQSRRTADEITILTCMLVEADLFRFYAEVQPTDEV